MEKIFYKKWTAIMFVAAILILVLLVCMLLTSLAQMSATKERIATFERLLEQAEQGLIEREQMLEYLLSDDYVREWAEEHDRVKQSDITWLEEKLSQK